MGDKERSDELTSRARWRRAGNEVEEAVQSEDEKDQAEKETSDDSGCLVDLKYIDTNIVLVKRLFQ
jgi:hypothetical protein